MFQKHAFITALRLYLMFENCNVPNVGNGPFFIKCKWFVLLIKQFILLFKVLPIDTV